MYKFKTHTCLYEKGLMVELKFLQKKLGRLGIMFWFNFGWYWGKGYSVFVINAVGAIVAEADVNVTCSSKFKVPWYIRSNPWLWIKGLQVWFLSMPGTFVLQQDTLIINPYCCSPPRCINGYPVGCERYLSLDVACVRPWSGAFPECSPGSWEGALYECRIDIWIQWPGVIIHCKVLWVVSHTRKAYSI